MGVEASYRRITPQEFEKLHSDAAYASIYFGHDLETDEDICTYFDALRSTDRYLDLDKYWQSLYLLFTGDSPYDSEKKGDTLLHKVFMGGLETPWEATYGCIRYLDTSEVNQIAGALNHISEDDFRLRLGRLLGSNESRVYMEPHFINLFGQLVKFFNVAAQEDNIVLLSFN